MHKEYNVVIADTSCFILLDKIDQLDLLRRVFKTISTTPKIVEEFNKVLPEWIKVQAPSNQNYSKLLEMEVDAGEASAISLALESENCLLILDDGKARKLASRLDLNYTGTLGVLL